MGTGRSRHNHCGEAMTDIECPKCKYVRRPSDVAPANECPRCGVIYEEYLAHQEATRRRLAEEKADELENARRTEGERRVKEAALNRIAACEDCGGTVSRLALSCPHCGRPFGRHVDASPVHVMDVRMDFMSMIGFMVKWAIASIPAFIILVTIFFTVVPVIGATLLRLRL